MEYQEFINNKSFKPVSSGFEPGLLPYPLFDYQDAIVRWACKRGKAAVFADTGLGKTIMQLSWADKVASETGMPVLVLAPLAVSEQTIAEGEKYGIKVDRYNQDKHPVSAGVFITNYEQLNNVEREGWGGIVLDESSILKGLQGKVRAMITDFAKTIPYRLSCTATPSPNDFMEIGTQAEFLGIMSQTEMLAMFFVNDMSDTGKWRLKGHGRHKFWEWLATWAVCIRSPADLGFDGSSHDLPPIEYRHHVVKTDQEFSLFPDVAQSLTDRGRARKDSLKDRCELAASIANGVQDSCIVWCNLNDEGDELQSLINGAVQVAGSDKPEKKTSAMLGFASGDVKKLVTKPKIAGFGMNWQVCNRVVFVGLSDSFEAFYQAVRRCHRFGQKRGVIVDIVSADTEGAVIENIHRKMTQMTEMQDEMIKRMKDLTMREIFGTVQEKTQYNPNKEMNIPKFLEEV